MKTTKAELLRSMDTFTRAYVAAALWSTNDESDEQGGEPLDKNYGPEDITRESLARIIAECETFQVEQADALKDADEAQAGHDFWLTRNGHGCGFWDGDWPEPQATVLTDASKGWGEVYLSVCRGKIHLDMAQLGREMKRKPKDAWPSYQDRDPRGWGGDPSRGAALGRGSWHCESDYVGELRVTRIHLDGDYDCNGTYFGGGGEPLFWIVSKDGDVDYVTRAKNIEDARSQARKQYPLTQIGGK